MSELGTAWGLTSAALVCAVPVLLYRIGERESKFLQHFRFSPVTDPLFPTIDTDEIVIEADQRPEVESIDMKKVESA